MKHLHDGKQDGHAGMAMSRPAAPPSFAGVVDPTILLKSVEKSSASANCNVRIDSNIAPSVPLPATSQGRRGVSTCPKLGC